MDDRDCVEFLQWALPRMRMRWPGFRRVRKRVCKRVDRRLRELGLADVAAYRAHLRDHPGEWSVLDGLCAVTISRFLRNRGVFETLVDQVLPELVASAHLRGAGALRIWSAGCACGEEAYTLAILASLHVPPIRLAVLGTDVDAIVLERARRGVYPHSSVREVPPPVRAHAFERVDGEYRVLDHFREHVTFLRMDVRTTAPEGRFDAVLCRNLAFTYFAEEQQRAVLDRFAERLHPGGALVVGAHEHLPDPVTRFVPWHPRVGVHRLHR